MTQKASGADYWFKPRRYGHGATPSTWQGWATIAAFAVAFPLVALALMWAMPNVWGILAILIHAAGSVRLHRLRPQEDRRGMALALGQGLKTALANFEGGAMSNRGWPGQARP